MTHSTARPEVVFAHGKESGPWGTKIQHLAALAKNQGCAVASPDYRGLETPEQRLAHLLEQPRSGRPLILVGSSMGGYVSAMACAELAPVALLLMAPALYLAGYPREPSGCPADTVVVHGWHDDTVPVDSSIAFARARSAELHLVADGHRLAVSIDFIGQCFARQLQRCTA
jgi:alpha/beta superfamily hydrolase